MNNEPKAGQGIDPELLAAYIDQRLSPEQRAIVEAQLASDPDSYELLVETTNAIDEIEGATVPEVPQMPKVPGVPEVLPAPGGRRVRWAMAGGALAAAAAIVLVVWTQPDLWQRLRGVEPADPLMAKLVNAIGEERYFEPRLSGGFLFGPLRETSRAADAVSDQNLSLIAAAGEAQKLAAAEPTATNLLAWGCAQMLLRDFDGAVVTLERARALGESAETAIALSATYYARAQAADRPDDLPRALASANQAVGLSPQSAEAWFNKALAETQLGLVELASQSWDTYQGLEQDPQWLAEGQRRHVLLRQRGQSWPLDKDVTGIRVRFTTIDLLEWAIATGEGDHDRRTAAMHTLAEAAEHMNRAGTDSQASDIVAALLAIPDTVLGARAASIAAFAQAARFAADDEQSKAGRLAAGVVDEFCRWSSPLCASARMIIATSLIASARPFAEVAAALARVEDAVGRRPYEALLGDVAWRRGLAHVRQGDFEPALAEYERAEQFYTRAGEWSNAANMHSLQSEAYRTLGDYRSAWRHHLRAQDILPPDAPYRIVHQLLAQVSLSCLSMGLPECALAAQTQAMGNAQRWGQSSGLAMVHVHRARALARMHQPEAAQELDRASSYTDTIADAEFRDRVRAEVFNASGELLGLQDPQDQLPAVANGIQMFEATGAANRAASLRLMRGRYLLTHERWREAAEDFESALAHLEAAHRRTDRIPLRNAQAAPVAALQLELAALAIRGGRLDDALDHVERSRVPVLANGELRAAAPLSVTAIQAALPLDTTLIYYATDLVVPSLWVVSASAIHYWPVSASSDELRTLVETYRRSGASTTDRSRVRLYGLLVGPVMQVSSSSKWVIVPDSIVSGLSIASLRNDHGVPLFDSKRVVVAPSGTVHYHLAQRRASGVASAAFLAYGAGDARARIPAIPQVEFEVAESARQYPSAQVYGGTRATPAMLQQMLHAADVVHVAAHAVGRAEYPSLSRLLLAPTEHRSGVVYADQISGFQGVKARVVVLAACRTGFAGVSAFAPGASILSLATAFLQAGVTQVVASIFDVPDGQSRRLMRSFHRHLAEHGDAAEALARAQRELDSDPESVTVVGAFQVYGIPAYSPGG